MQRDNYRPRKKVTSFCGLQQPTESVLMGTPFMSQDEGDKARLKDQILLDSGSGVSATFMNKDMVHTLRQTTKPIIMNTNAGDALLDKVATVPGWGEVHFHEEGMANIFGLSHMAKKHRVTMDSAIENAF